MPKLIASHLLPISDTLAPGQGIGGTPCHAELCGEAPGPVRGPGRQVRLRACWFDGFGGRCCLASGPGGVRMDGRGQGAWELTEMGFGLPKIREAPDVKASENSQEKKWCRHLG